MRIEFSRRAACALGATALLVLAACGERPRIEPGLYRAVLTLPGGELPFGLEFREEQGALVGYLINGPERVRVPDVKVDGHRIEMSMPGFGNRLSARLKRGRLEGEVVLVKLGLKEQKLPLVAERDLSYRFFKEPLTDNADVTGRWAVTFRDGDGKQSPAIGEFRQSHGEVTGTFLTQTGDHRYLAGEMRNNELYLSTFDGAHAYLYRAQLTPTGELEGKYWSGLSPVEEWSGRRDEHAKLADADTLTTIRDDTWSFGFTFPDETGKPVSIADARFKNKVMIVALGGSWCPNCHDEAAFLAPLYKEYRERGFEIVELMFERSGDFAPASKAVAAMRAKFGIEYPTLIAGISDKDDASTRLPQLSSVYAFPTTLFVDRKGRVRRIYTGFSGPATGAHYQELTASFIQTLEALLAEGS
ncbi:MAG TPA: TlpA disulfide reductase family protein [Steroidobacteraceae bacterium]|nr:TlpA disulfide reductase family protein [Steroidobacteraceae bacterium]